MKQGGEGGNEVLINVSYVVEVPLCLALMCRNNEEPNS